MPELSFSEMLRLGGVPSYISVLAVTVILGLLVGGFVTLAPKSRRRPSGAAVKKWSWAMLISGLVCAFNGGVGTITGLINVYRAAAAAGGNASAVMAQGVFEVLFNVVFGFGFAFLALFGYLAVRLAAGEGRLADKS